MRCAPIYEVLRMGVSYTPVCKCRLYEVYAYIYKAHAYKLLMCGISDPGYRGEACQPLDLDLVDLEGEGHFRIRKVQPEV